MQMTAKLDTEHSYNFGGMALLNYRPLYRLMKERGIGWEELREGIGASPGTTAKIHRGVPVSMDVVDRICRYFGCRIEDILEYED